MQALSANVQPQEQRKTLTHLCCPTFKDSHSSAFNFASDAFYIKLCQFISFFFYTGVFTFNYILTSVISRSDLQEVKNVSVIL